MARKPADPAQDLPDDALTLEQALKQLESVIARLEQADLPLESALTLSEQGQKLVALCNARIAQAELKLSQLGASA